MDDMHDRIRERAYEIWVSEGCPEGAEERHWHQAVRDVSGADQGLADDPGLTDSAAAEDLSGIADAAGDGVLTDGKAAPRPLREVRSSARARSA